MAAPGNWTLVNQFRTKLLTKNYNLDTDSLKVALFTSSSNIGPTSTTYAALTNELANANGYTTGGIAVDLNLSGTTSVQAAFATNPVWTVVTGNLVARRAGLYVVGGDVWAFMDLDSAPADVTVTPGNQLTIDNDGSPNPFYTFN